MQGDRETKVLTSCTHPPVSVNVGADLDAAERKAIEVVRRAFAELRGQAGTSAPSYGGVV